MHNPVVEFVQVVFFVLQQAAYDVYNSKLGSNWDIDVPNRLVIGQDEASCSLFKEVYVVDLVLLEVDVLVVQDEARFEQGADPADEEA